MCVCVDEEYINNNTKWLYTSWWWWWWRNWCIGDFFFLYKTDRHWTNFFFLWIHGFYINTRIMMMMMVAAYIPAIITSLKMNPNRDTMKKFQISNIGISKFFFNFRFFCFVFTEQTLNWKKRLKVLIKYNVIFCCCLFFCLYKRWRQLFNKNMY